MKEKGEPEHEHERMASDALVEEARALNECFVALGLADRMILIHDDDTGFAISGYVTTLKEDRH